MELKPEPHPKAELLIFNRKEIVVVIVLFVLVALFSFTLGLKLGKTLGAAKNASAEPAPFAEKNGKEQAPAPAVEAAHHADGEQDGHEGALAESSIGTPAKPVAESTAAKKVEDLADSEFAGEADKQKVGIPKPLPMALPQEKKSEGALGVRYTLQVGSHRTVAEATEQVSSLKKGDLDAFYIEVKIPGKGTWYRVGIGTFAGREEAERAAAKWKGSKALPPFIVQKINE